MARGLRLARTVGGGGYRDPLGPSIIAGPSLMGSREAQRDASDANA